MTPTAAQLAAFQDFITNTMQVSVGVLPSASPVIVTSLSIALEFVNQQINIISTDLYTLALNNLAADLLIRWASDQPGQNYFANARTAFGLNTFMTGAVSGSKDESTSVSLKMPKFYENLSVFDLQCMQTPYGRQYLAIAQQFGTLWGLT